MAYINEAKDLKVTPAPDASDDIRVASSSDVKSGDDSHEVFQQADGKVNFRTVSWIRASAIFLKSMSPTSPLQLDFTHRTLSSAVRNRHPLHPISNV